MADAAQRLKANLRLENQPCGRCGRPFVLGDDAAVCNACGASQHAVCWDGAGGCSAPGCVNAPLQQMAPPPQPAPGWGQQPGYGAAAYGQLPPNSKQCPQCRQVIHVMAMQCPFCNAIATPDGLYHGPQQNAPGAVQALVYALVGLVICGLIFGIVAINKSREAKAAIRMNPQYTGAGLATAGMVIGIIDIIAWGLILISRLGNM